MSEESWSHEWYTVFGMTIVVLEISNLNRKREISNSSTLTNDSVATTTRRVGSWTQTLVLHDTNFSFTWRPIKKGRHLLKRRCRYHSSSSMRHRNKASAEKWCQTTKGREEDRWRGKITWNQPKTLSLENGVLYFFVYLDQNSNWI